MVTNQDAMNDEDDGGMLPWKMIILSIIIGISLWLLFGNEQLCTADKRLCYTIWHLYTFIAILLLWIVRVSYIWLKYKSPQFVGNNIHGSITGRRPISAGKFYLIRLGGIDCTVTTEGREGTVVFPHESYNRLGSQVAVPARFSKRSIDQLDLIVQQKIRESGFPTPIWYGDIDESQFHIDPNDLDSILNKQDISRLKQLNEDMGNLKRFNPAQLHLLLKDAWELISKYKKERETLMGSAESVVAFGARIHDKAKHIGGIRRVLPSRKTEDDQ